MPGAGLQGHSYVALGLEGSQRVAFEQQHAPAVGVLDVLSQHILEKPRKRHLSLVPARRITSGTLQPDPGTSPVAVPINPGNTRECNHSNWGCLLHPASQTLVPSASKHMGGPRDLPRPSWPCAQAAHKVGG